MKSELGITVSVGVSFNKIFAKLGSDYKKPDAITTMYKSEFKQKAWSLPVADLLYVGKSTNRKLALFGIKTIGDLARTDEDVLNSHLGKIGSKPVRNPEGEKPKWEDTITNRMLHWSYTPEQKEEVKKALAAGVPKATILTYFYPEVTV